MINTYLSISALYICWWRTFFEERGALAILAMIFQLEGCSACLRKGPCIVLGTFEGDGALYEGHDSFHAAPVVDFILASIANRTSTTLP